MKITEYIKQLFAQKKQVGFIARLFPRRGQSEATLREVIEELIEDNNSLDNGELSIDEDEREMLGNVLNLRDIQVQDIMIPRVEIKALPITTKIEELISEFVESQVSSILVYQGTIDNIIGAVYLKDIVNWFRMNKPFNVSIFVKEILFIPPTMRTLDLLLKMKQTGIKVSVVVDEYGGVEGFVSFTDLAEEIIGDIESVEEQRHNQKKVIRNSDGTYTIDARTTIAEINKIAGINIISSDNSVDSLGGHVFSIAGKVPVRGELIFCDKQNIEFEILEADSRKIKSIKLRKK
ncbi:MAG: hemolysin family protein [Holosporales bacterium]|jgi:CBS domain containing-hemolysin-like protein|nr:hemolysin family protein [Holosporales bacterium]